MPSLSADIRYGILGFCRLHSGFSHILSSLSHSTLNTVSLILQNYMLPQLSYHDDGTVIVQQNGAWPHFPTEFRDYFDAVFSGKWIGNAGFIAWP
jgi:hypothetical protein